MTVEIQQTVVLSTGHVTESTAQWLDGDEAPLAVWKSEYGYMMFVWEKDSPTFGELPPDLQAVMAYAKKHGGTYVLLDRDADKAEDLNLFDW